MRTREEIALDVAYLELRALCKTWLARNVRRSGR
jgi:hypothetical protein